MALRIVLIVAAIVVVIAVTRLIARWQRPSHPPIDLGDFGPRPGVVLFTSTDCANCKEALALVRSLDLPHRVALGQVDLRNRRGVGPLIDRLEYPRVDRLVVHFVEHPHEGW